MTSTTPRPALSISTTPGTPSPWMTSSSRARISAAETIRISTLPRRGRALGDGAYGGDHLAHRPLHPDEHRSRDDGVANVELLDAGQGSDGCDVEVVETMAGCDVQPEPGPERARSPQSAQLFCLL